MEDNVKLAQEVCNKIGLTIDIFPYPAGDNCPPWAKSRHFNYCKCGDMHGNKYRITLTKSERFINFDYWNSRHDLEIGKNPSIFEILACIMIDLDSPTDPDEVYKEFCNDLLPSDCIRIAKQAKKLKGFFSKGDCKALNVVMDRFV